MLLCKKCHVKRLPCAYRHKMIPIGKCEACGESQLRISCDKKVEPMQWTPASVYRFTGWLEYPRRKK